MYVKKTSGYAYTEIWPAPQFKGLLDTYSPETFQSSRWKHWKAILDLRLCEECRSHHGKIYSAGESPDVEPPLHENCRCTILPMEAIMPGGATKDGENGADYWLVHYGKLPDYYITDQDLRALGWRNGKPPKRFAPEKMYSGGIYDNEDGHLPSSPGRIWYEADINYYEGKRNKHRILFSNDGLIFVTYDHYQTFYEIYTGGQE